MVRATASIEAKAKASAYNVEWKKKHVAQNTSIADKIRNREKEYKRVRCDNEEGYRQLYLTNIKARCKKRGLPFNLTLEDIIIPEICPVLGIKLETRIGKFHDNSPSLDRLIPELGYIKKNVRIISYRANRIKCHASIEDLEKILAYMKREI
jgi:hypothetical protein